MVDRSSSKRCVPIQIRLAVKCYNKEIRAINLIGKVFSCREKRYRVGADIARLLFL